MPAPNGGDWSGPLWQGARLRIVENDTIWERQQTGRQGGDGEMTPHWLLGIWRLHRADEALDFAPGVRMEFAAGGHLRYHIDVAGNDQTVHLLYRVDGDTLHTENPLAPHSMVVQFDREGGDVLVLDFGGARAWLLRE